MADRIIIDLRLALRNFDRSVARFNVKIPEYVYDEIVALVFDALIYELEGHYDRPDLTRLGNFYRDFLERDPRFLKVILESFFDIIRDVVTQLKGHGLLASDGFEFRPERTNKNRSIVVKKFDSF